MPSQPPPSNEAPQWNHSWQAPLRYGGKSPTPQFGFSYKTQSVGRRFDHLKANACAEVAISAVAGELLLPPKVVTAIIIFFSYL